MLHNIGCLHPKVPPTQLWAKGVNLNIMKDLLKLFANAADGVFIINKDQQIVYWNKAAQKILGYTSAEVIGQPCYNILRGCNDKGQIVCHQNCNISVQAHSGDSVPDYDLVSCTKSGEIRWINVTILTSFLQHNGSPFIIHLFRDTTKIKQNEQFIRQMFQTVGRWQKQVALTAVSGPKASDVGKLTKREREVLLQLVHGLSTTDIAETLSISPATVRNHVQRILQKLQVHSRLEAIAFALEHGIVPDIDPKSNF